MTNPIIRCGFIGLGSQGAPMAERIIAAGFPVVLWARRPESLDRFLQTAACFASSIADLAHQVDHVGICVVSDEDVKQVCGELLPNLPTGASLAIHSTVHPDTVRQLYRDAAARGVALIDAPVSGGEPAALAGTLTVMIGSSAGALDRCRPIFEAFGSSLFHLGDVGAGQNAKLVNNALLAANMAMADHALGAGDRLGLDKTALVNLICASSGNSFGFNVRSRLPNAVAFSHGGSLLLKDVRLLLATIGDDEDVVGLAGAAEPFLVSCTAT